MAECFIHGFSRDLKKVMPAPERLLPRAIFVNLRLLEKGSLAMVRFDCEKDMNWREIIS